MTTLNHNEFDNTDNTSESLREEEHDYVVTVNDSGFFGDEDSLGPETVDQDGFADYDDTAENSHLAEAHEPVEGESGTAEVADDQPVPEALGEHRDGESVGEWLRNDWEQTKQDLHIGKPAE